MIRYFQVDGSTPFVLFSYTHWLTLITIALSIFMIFLGRKKLHQEGWNRYFSYGIALILILSELSLHSWIWWIDAWSIQYSLPFHLSSISLILTSIVLLTNSFPLFEFTYFAGVGSALQAMITPDISRYTFPHFRYVHFFISHGGIVVGNMYMVFVNRFIPTYKSLWKAFFYLNMYTVFVLILNYLVEGNYMYVSRKPVNPSVIDYLGPWPYYIFSLEVIALITFHILFIPFWVMGRKR